MSHCAHSHTVALTRARGCVQSLFGIPPPITTDNDLWGDPNSIDYAGAVIVVCLHSYGEVPHLLMRTCCAGFSGRAERVVAPGSVDPSSGICHLGYHPLCVCTHACTRCIAPPRARVLPVLKVQMKDIIIIWRRARSVTCMRDVYALRSPGGRSLGRSSGCADPGNV